MKSKTKRALLGLGVTATVVSPIATVIACSSSKTAENLTDADFSNFVNSSKLPSEVTPEDVADFLVGIGVWVTPEDVALIPNDVAGKLLVTISYTDADGAAQENPIELTGFQTQAERDVIVSIQTTLKDEIVDPASYGTFVDEDEVLQVIQIYVSTVLEGDLVFASNDAEGTLTITILNYYEEGNDLIIALEGFQKYDKSDTIPANAYEDETLPTWFTVPETVTTIGEKAFYSAEFWYGDFVLPNSVTTIGTSAFAYATFYENFILPYSVTTIGDYAFKDTTFHGEFTLANTQVETIGEYVFKQTTLPDGFALPNSVTTIGDSAFYEATFLGDFSLANTQVTNIAYKTFYMTEFFGDVVLPDSLTQIYWDAFSGATFLGDFTLANTQVERINSNAFYGVTLPTGFALPNSLTTIDDSTFEGATLPDGFAIPKNVTTIGDDAFKDVQMAENLTWYDENNVEQTPEDIPGPGWYIAPKS